MTISGDLVFADHQPAAATAAVATLTGVAGFHIRPKVVHWSYDAAPTGGSLTIVSNATTIAKISITAAGPGYLPLDGFKTLAKGDSLVATLASGAGAVSGMVSMSGEFDVKD